MTERQLEQALEVTRQALTHTGKQLRKYFGNIDTLNKGDGSAVEGVFTKLDHETELYLRQELSGFSADIGFRGEEFGVHTESDTTWLVDPIDGTAHFIRGIPFCTTMVCLIENGQVVMSVIHDFVRDDLYWAIRGKGAYCNDVPISVSQRTLKQGLLSFETRLEKPDNFAKYIEVRQQTPIVSMINCGMEFILVATGKIEGRIGLDPYGQDWDFAPGSLLVTEAGGVATNIGLASYDYRNHDYLITNAIVHKELTEGPGAVFPVL